MKKVVFFIPTFKHEDHDDLAIGLDQAVGGTVDRQVVQQLASLPIGETIVVDSLHRLGDTADRVATTLSKILEHGEIWIPNVLDLRHSNPDFESLFQLVKFFGNIKRSVKSARIREALFIKAQLNGRSMHDSGITPELKKLVIEQFVQIQRVRETARVLTSMGYPISASSVSRILREVKSNG